jgi:hypothetical protein
MTTPVRQLLSKFDALTPEDQCVAVTEMLRRISALDSMPLSDEELTDVADAAFTELDAREARTPDSQ